MREVHIASTGLWIPEHKVSNDELIESFNKYVDKVYGRLGKKS